MEGIVKLKRISYGDNSRNIGRAIIYNDTKANVINALLEPLPPNMMTSPLISASVYRLDGSIDIHLENKFFALVGTFTPDQPKAFY